MLKSGRLKMAEDVQERESDHPLRPWELAGRRGCIGLCGVSFGGALGTSLKLTERC